MKRNYYVVALIMLIFFVISLITNILGPIIPDIIESFDLSLTLVGLLPFSFFIAYGVMSIPAGMMLEKYQGRKVMLGAFGLAMMGSLVFAFFPRYGTAIVSLFMIGAGLAVVQVAINPLLRIAGGEKHFAFNSVMAQLVFGSAAFISPQLYSYLIFELNSFSGTTPVLIHILHELVPESLPWVSMYWIFAVVLLFMVLVMKVVRLPKVELKEEEKAGTWFTHRNLLKNKTVILFFIGIFAYVGTEQGVANWISKFLATYHGFDPQTTGADAVSYFWGLLTAGCLLGLVFLKLFDSRKVLIGFAAAALLSLTIGLFGPASMALYGFPLVGFFASVMWAVIFSLALNSVDKHHGSFSGILCTAIIGGAVVPLLIGWLGDSFGLRTGMFILYLTLGYILSIGFWAKPLINNETLSRKKKIIEEVTAK